MLETLVKPLGEGHPVLETLLLTTGSFAVWRVSPSSFRTTSSPDTGGMAEAPPLAQRWNPIRSTTRGRSIAVVRRHLAGNRRRV